MTIPKMRIVSASNTVMLVDDQATSRFILEQIVRNIGETILVQPFERSADALQWAATHVADLVVLDHQMPDMDGIELAKRLRRLEGYEHVPLVMITASEDRKIRYLALDAGITDFLGKPVDSRECVSRCRNLITLRRQQSMLEDHKRILEGMVQDATRDILERERETIIRLARAGEFRDEETGSHVMRMARYSALIARAIGMDGQFVEMVECSAPLHDIGKIAIPDHVLKKPGRLDADELVIMRRHAALGYDILKESPSQYLRMGALIALGHHEKVDGTGYPRGLSGEDIPLAARIVAVADVYDALNSERPYKPAWPEEEVIAYLKSVRGTHLDAALVDAFLGKPEEIARIKRELPDAARAKLHA